MVGGSLGRGLQREGVGRAVVAYGSRPGTRRRMSGTKTRLVAANTSFVDLRTTHPSVAQPESGRAFGPLANLPSGVGRDAQAQVLSVATLLDSERACSDLGLYRRTQIASSRRDDAPRARDQRIPLPDRWSDVATDEAVGVVAVSAERALGDTVTVFGDRAREVGRNG